MRGSASCGRSQEDWISTLCFASRWEYAVAVRGGIWREERALADQGKTMQLLSKLGFSLVLHGHTHFSGIHSHRIRVLNGPTPNEKISKILTVACSRVSAEPNSAAPHRQYFVLKLGAFEETSGTRSFALETRLFNAAKRTWHPGEAVPVGELDIDSSE